MSAAPLGFQAATSSTDGPAGTLQLSVARRGGRTQPAHTHSQGVLRLLKPLYLDDSGQVSYFVVNPGGAYFGESCHFDVEVQPGASLLLSSQGATRIYRTPRRPAVQEADFVVGAGGRFEYVPDQTIAYRDADYRQHTRLTVAPDATAFIGEIVTPGWDPDGKPFTYTGMRLRLDVRSADGGLVCCDNVRIIPERIGPAIVGLGYLEGASHMGSAVVIGPQVAASDYVERVRELVAGSGLSRVGLTTGRRHGVDWLMVRGLASSTEALSQLLLDVNEHDRGVVTGQQRLDLRRY